MQLEVKGSNIPRPITAWSQLPLNEQCKFICTFSLTFLWSSELKSNRVELLFTHTSPNASNSSCFKET